MIELNECKYIFLETIYRGSGDVTEILELVMSDAFFRKVEFYRCSLKEAEEIYQKLQGSGTVLDFSFSEGFLKCGSNVKESPVNNLVKETGFVGSIVSNNNLYDLLSLGQEDFIFMEDSVLEREEYIGSEVQNFSCVQFAKTTMTVYVPMLSNKGLYNKVIVSLIDNYLQFRRFFFGVPVEKGGIKFPGCDYVKTMKINNIDYNIYDTAEIVLYDTENSLRLSNPLINKAMCNRERNVAGKFALKHLRKSLVEFTDSQEKNVVWSGGNGSYKSDYGVTFRSSMPSFGEDSYQTVQRFLLEKLSNGVAVSDIKREISLMSWSSNAKYAAMCILPIISMASDNVVEDIAAIDSLLSFVNKQILVADAYLYRVRANSYVRHLHLASVPDIRIFGGNEADITYVTEGFYYDDIG